MINYEPPGFSVTLTTGKGVYGTEKTVSIDNGQVEFNVTNGNVEQGGGYHLPTKELASIARALRGLRTLPESPNDQWSYYLYGRIDGRSFKFAADPYNIPLLRTAAIIGGLANRAKPQTP